MAMFGKATVPGYGGGAYDINNPFGIPDYMAGINDALARNAAQQQAAPPKKRNKLGHFLEAFAGTYGDALTGNPVYAQSLKDKRDDEEAQRSSQAQKDWWYEQQRYQQANKKDDLPGLIDEFTTAQSLGMLPPDMKYTDYVSLKNPGMQTPIVEKHNWDRVDDGGDVTAVNPQTGEKIRYNPNTSSWEKVGGPSPQGSGGFPGH